MAQPEAGLRTAPHKVGNEPDLPVDTIFLSQIQKLRPPSLEGPQRTWAELSMYFLMCSPFYGTLPAQATPDKEVVLRIFYPIRNNLL